MTEEKSAAADIRAKLAQLRELRDQLDAHDVALNDLVPDVEHMFKSLHLGVSISMRIEEGETWARWLTFEKLNKQWRLCQITGPLDGDPDDYTTTPVSDLPRDTRAKILGYDVPRLLDAGVEHMEKRIEERRRVIDSTNELLHTVGEFVANGAEPPEQQHLSLLHEAALGLANGARAGTVTVTLHPPLGQSLPPLTLPGELPGPPAVPVKPVTLSTSNPLYDAVTGFTEGPVLTKIVDDGTKPKPGKVHKKWRKL